MTSKNCLLSLVVFTLLFAMSCSSTVQQRADVGVPGSNSPAQVSNQAAPANATPANLSPASVPQALETRTGKKLVDDESSDPLPPPSFKPAGEDSKIAVTMRPDGLMQEIRIFMKHPELEKVEATWLGAREKSLTFFLRNGRTIEVKTDRLTNLQNAASSLLLEIAGLKAPVRATDTSAADGKKSPAQ